MDISSMNIQYFAKDEYSNLVKPDIDGNDTLIYGNNRTGKTLTLNAILYNLLGAKETIDLSTGRGNQVGVEYSNGIRFYRGVPEAEYQDDSDHLTAEDGRAAFSSRLCEDLSQDIPKETLIKTHFLHTHVEQLPLNSLSADDRLSLIRTVVDRKSQDLLEKHQRAKAEIDQLVRDWELTLSELRDDYQDIDDELSSAESQLHKWRNLKEMVESGRLSEINVLLQGEDEIRDKLSAVYQEQEGLRKERRTLNKEKKQWERYHENEVVDVIATAVEDFVCPVCAGHVSSEKAENRAGQGYCPFCGQERTLHELKEDIRERIDLSNDRLDEIESRLEEISERMDELDTREEELKSEIPSVEELDSFTERRLRENSYEIEGIIEKAEEEIERNKRTVEKSTQKTTTLETRITEIQDSLEVLEESSSFSEARISELINDSQNHVEEFVREWEENYEKVADDLSLRIGISEDGEIVLPGNTADRTLDQDGDLSAAEVRLLNTSFVVTVNEFAQNAELTKWNTIVLDEPFTNLDDDGQRNLIEYIRDLPQQFIVTTSDANLQDEFPESLRLERNTIQTTFHQFNQ